MNQFDRLCAYIYENGPRMFNGNIADQQELAELVEIRRFQFALMEQEHPDDNCTDENCDICERRQLEELFGEPESPESILAEIRDIALAILQELKEQRNGGAQQ